MAQAGDGGGGAPRFLVVHEDGTSLLAVKRDLERHGAQALGARTVEKCLERLSGPDRVDAVLLHWGMALLDAGRVAWEVRQLGAGAPPVIAFSGGWSAVDIKRAIQLGAAAIIGSPIKIDQMLAELGRIQPNQNLAFLSADLKIRTTKDFLKAFGAGLET